MIAADDVAVRGHQHRAADGHATGRKHLAVEPDVGGVAELDVAVLAGQNRIAADKDAVPDAYAAVRLALGVEQTVVVDDDVAADVNLVRMAEHDVLAKHDVAAARTEQPGVKHLSQQQTERARSRLRQRDDQLVHQQGAQAGTSDHQLGVLRPCRLACREQLLLKARDRLSGHTGGRGTAGCRIVGGLRSSHASGTSQAFDGSLRGAQRVVRTRPRSARG